MPQWRRLKETKVREKRKILLLLRNKNVSIKPSAL
jgi:hypothetical protein